ncbi:MAG: rod shape-determining protein MreC [Nitriliruptoraceae bacterium]
MFQRRRAGILLAVVILVSLVLITLDFRGEEDAGPFDGLRTTVGNALRPLQDGVSTLVAPFGDAAERVGELFRLRSENQQLRGRVEDLEERTASRVDLERENLELRQLLDMADRTELDTVAARVVALSPSNFEWTVTIDVSAEDGIERGMISGAGLVGRIIQTSDGASRVLLAIDPNFAAAARTARTGEVGTIEGRGGDPMLLRLLDPEADVEAGDEIVTSSYDEGVFPAGIPIGEVRQVVDGEGRLTREAEVNPFVAYSQLHHVMVVRTDGVEPLPAFDSTEDLEFDVPELSPDDDDDEQDGDAPGGDGAEEEADTGSEEDDDGDDG